MEQAGPYALPAHLHEPEITHGERLRTGPILPEVLPEFPRTFRLLASLSISMKSITMIPPMSRSRSCRGISLRGEKIGLGGSSLPGPSSHVPTGVDVDRHQCLGLVDRDVAPLLQPYLAIEGFLDFPLDVELVKNGLFVPVKVDSGAQMRAERLEILLELFVLRSLSTRIRSTSSVMTSRTIPIRRRLPRGSAAEPFLFPIAL